MPDSERTAHYRCNNCDSPNVQVVMWVRINTDEVIETFDGPADQTTTRCEDCDQHSGVTFDATGDGTASSE